MADLHTHPLDSALRILIESISIICVNVFVMISGWFGIRPKVRSITGFIFQCLFFLIGIYAVLILTGQAQPDVRGIAGCFLLTESNWFPKAYILLYILSPALNALVEHSRQQQLRLVIIFYFLFQTVYGWVSPIATSYIEGGYSPLHFIGLYLLSRYAYVYRPRWIQWMARTDFMLLGLLIVVNSALPYAATFDEHLYGIALNYTYAYANPLVIAAALLLLSGMSKLKFRSKAVNWIAASSFAVYLLHANPNIIYAYFKPLCIGLYEMWGTAYYAMVLPVMAAIFAAAVLIDRVRLWVWHRVEKPIERLIDRVLLWC